MSLTQLLVLLAYVCLSVVGATLLSLVLVAVAQRLDPIIRTPWVCGDCKARYATEAEVVDHERYHGSCRCGSDHHHPSCSRRAAA